MKRIIEIFNKIIFVVFTLFMTVGFNDCTVGVFEGGSDLSALNIKYYNTNEKSELGKPENYAVHYFSNLLENFGNNRFETCGFVSLGMILSFYDTYWDDSIVPEHFEQTTKFNYGGFSLDLLSPGVINEKSLFPSNGIALEDYCNLVNAYENTFFHFKLLKIGQACLTNKINIDNGVIRPLTFDECSILFNYTLSSYCNLASNQFSVTRTTYNVRNFAISFVRLGIPVCLGLRKNDPINPDGHFAVAYDYNEETDELFCHFGTNANLTHVTPESLGYSLYDNAIAVQINTNHMMNHSNNYWCEDLFGNVEYYCACRFAVPHRVEFKKLCINELNPCFSWFSLNDEKWCTGILFLFAFEIRIDGILFYNDYLASAGTYLMTPNQLNSINLDSNIEITINVIGTGPQTYSDYWDVFSYSKEFQIDEYEWAYNIKPVDYAFPRTTVTSQTDTFKSGDGTIIFTQGRMVSATNRGFIKMTPQRIGQHESWLTFHFSRQIMSLSVQLSRWLSEENLVLPSISLFSLESYKNGHWIEEVNLLSLDDQLPLGELNAKWYHFTFSETVDTFRFRLGVSSGLLQNGSVCIGNIAVWRNLPTSGSELQFDLIQWNESNIKTFSSSFGYSLNNQTYPGSGYIWDNQQPGQFGFREIQPPYTYERVFNYLNADFEYYNQCMETNLSLEKIDKFETCKPGSYKIAFALCGDQFSTYMLWFRQDNDGYWSTKKAGLAPTQYDDNGNRILDPEYCRIDGYQEFVGFYSVNPWGNLYYE